MQHEQKWTMETFTLTPLMSIQKRLSGIMRVHALMNLETAEAKQTRTLHGSTLACCDDQDSRMANLYAAEAMQASSRR